MSLTKLLIVASLLLISSNCFADDLKIISYEEVADCKYPSVRICHKDENGQEHCAIKQDERCADGR